jgi:Domain of unknown function (DUF4349)
MTSIDIARELRAARPAAPEQLRDRVHTIVTTEPPRRLSLAEGLGTWRSSMRLPRPRLALVLVPAAAVLVAVGVGIAQLASPSSPVSPGASEPLDQSSLRAEKSPSAAAPAADATAAAPAYGQVGGVEAERSGLPVPAPDRAQRTTATLTLEVADTDALSAATQKAIAATRALGGYVVSVSYGSSATGSASLAVKVPSDRVQDALARLTALGSIASQNVQIDDLQSTLDATNRRIATLRKRIATISARLESAPLSADERGRLETSRQGLRDELAGDRQSATAIRGEAAFATIELELRTASEGMAGPATSSRLDRAVDDAVGILVVEAMVLLYAAVVIGPLLALFAVWAGARSRIRIVRAR